MLRHETRVIEWNLMQHSKHWSLYPKACIARDLFTWYLTDVGHPTNHLFAVPTCLECAIASNILDVPDKYRDYFLRRTAWRSETKNGEKCSLSSSFKLIFWAQRRGLSRQTMALQNYEMFSFKPRCHLWVKVLWTCCICNTWRFGSCLRVFRGW